MTTLAKTVAKPNWPAIRLAYLNQEGSLRALSQRFNAPLRSLERRCSRECWRHFAERVGGDVAAIAGELAATQGRELAVKLSLPERSAALKERIVSELETDIAQVEKTPPKNLSDSMDRQSVLSSVTRSAEVVLEWNSPRPTPAVRIDVMARTVFLNEQEPPLSVNPAPPAGEITEQP